MREIEIKVRVQNVLKLLETLDSLHIKLGSPKKQHDVVYAPVGVTTDTPGVNWLRIRTENDSTVYFTLKRSVTGELDSIEHETIVENAQEIQSIIALLGYELFSELTKNRQKAQVDTMELCFDEVHGLGTYLEVERLCVDDVNPITVQQALWQFVEQLGLSPADAETHGYDVLMRMKDGTN